MQQSTVPKFVVVAGTIEPISRTRKRRANSQNRTRAAAAKWQKSCGLHLKSQRHSKGLKSNAMVLFQSPFL